MRKNKLLSALVVLSMLASMLSGMVAFADDYWSAPEDKITDSSITFEWTSWDENAAFYKVSDRGNLIDTYENNGAYSYTLTGLSPNTSYSITVTAIGGEPSYSWYSSKTMTAKTKSGTEPAIGEVLVDKTAITVNLDRVSETGANIASVYDETNEKWIAENQAFTGTQFNISNLEQFTTYTVTIDSTTGEFETLTTTNTTRGARTTEVTDTSIKIEWDSLDAESTGHAYYIVNENWAEIQGQTYIQSSPLILEGLKPDTEYEIKIIPLKTDWNWCGDQWIYQKTLPAQGSSGGNDKVQAMRWNNDMGEDFYTDFGTELGQKQTVYHGTYESALMQTEVGYNIYLPASYDASDTDKRYPVLYVLHGLGGDENTFIDQTWGFPYIEALRNAGDNIIIVFVNNADYGWYTDSQDGLVPARSTVIDELIPHIDATYNTIADGKSRAIDGFSMGGQGALALAFENPEMFSSVIAYAPGLAHSLDTFVSMGWTDPLNEIFCYNEDPQAAEEYYQIVNAFAVLEQNKDAIAASGMKVKLVWGENDAVGNVASDDMYTALETAGVNVAKKVIPGFDHNSPYYGNESYESIYYHIGNLQFETPQEPGGDAEEVTELGTFAHIGFTRSGRSPNANRNKVSCGSVL